MKPSTLVLASVGALAALAHVALAAGAGTRTAPASPSVEARLERGRVLVHRVVLCTDCHSPRNEQGEHIESRHLTGAAVPFQPVVPMPWATFAPGLAGIPAGYTEAQLVHFLMTGERPHGLPAPRPPMPPYRLDRDDAEAVAAYLKSLPRTTD